MDNVKQIIDSLTREEQRIFREILALEKQNLSDVDLEANKTKVDELVKGIVVCVNRSIQNEN